MVGSIRVLLVDDDPPLADLMASRLEQLREEFSVIVETDPNDALERFSDDSIDCIISDYHMPTMNGLELLRCVRDIDPNVPFVLFTARGSEEIASEAVSMGVTDYFKKQRGDDQFHAIANRIENAVVRSRTETAIRRREQALTELSRAVTDSVSTPIDQLLAVGRTALDVEYATFARVDGDSCTVVADSVADEASNPIDETAHLPTRYCQLTADAGELVTLTGLDVEDEAVEHGFECRSYIGVPVDVVNEPYGVLSFRSRTDRESFSTWERAFVELLGDWFSHRLTSDWARDQRAVVDTVASRLNDARAALESSDDEAVAAELDAIESLLEQSPVTEPVSIELS